MIPFLTFPAALFSLLSIPLLVAIYWFRSRSQRYPVSSLILWTNQRESRQGGRRLQRIQTPLLLFLELMVLALLAVAAATPLLSTGGGRLPVVVVLDDSFSMLAGNENTAHHRAVRRLKRELLSDSRYAIRFVLAGTEPQVLGWASEQSGDTESILDRWQCLSPRADLDAAVAFAHDLGGPAIPMLVVTDQSPPASEIAPRLRWWAFGSAPPNVAFVNAQRTRHGGSERCLFEISNLSPVPAQRTLVVSTASSEPQSLHKEALVLEPQETRRLILKLPMDAPAIRAGLDRDALTVDDEVVLLSEPLRTVRVRVDMEDEILGDAVERALTTTEGCKLVEDRPELIVFDNDPPAQGSPGVWTMQFVREENSVAYLGPFIVDRTHALLSGVSFGGVIWGAGESEGLSGVPVVSAGNIPLLTDQERFDGSHHLRLRLQPDLSTLHESANWPILFWNLIEWRASHQPGLSRANVRLGEDVVLTLAQEAGNLDVIPPDGAVYPIAFDAHRAHIRTETVGIHEVRSEDGSRWFASNALSAPESDLTQTVSGEWGNWVEPLSAWSDTQNLRWVLLLGALLILAWHAMLLARRHQS